ncbi:T-cell activation inhibitor, mitochondrial isoform X2 [Oratosquilla oratoria]|uniref:T-cell activation inhibitor, mitochondrial isoform X2 n=1 Tax=Oratosquilla oratoria TaxID=337810 RepID=UPI003F775A9D
MNACAYFRRRNILFGAVQNYKGFCHVTRRKLTSAQVTTALRPFYFLVHPDLFAQYPRAQHINDSSLKQLNSHLDQLVDLKKPQPLDLQFYIKNTEYRGSMKTVSLKLDKKSAKAAVQSVLSEFNLPTKYVDKLEERVKRGPDRDISWEGSAFRNTFSYEDFNAPRKKKLYPWLIKNMGDAEKRLAQSEPIRKDIVRLSKALQESLQLSSLTWERGLGTTHLRGCLQGLTALAKHHPSIRELLRDRHVHFGNETGVSLKGCIVLSNSEVRDQWLKNIVRAPDHDAVIQRIPHMQKAISNSLNDIQVTHRKYQPFHLAQNYIKHLERFVTSLGDYRSRNGFPKSWPDSLAHLQLVVEAASGPLMISPTGQILVPSSCPPVLLINFITDHMKEAEEKILGYERIRDREKSLYALCKEELGLAFLDKDDSVLPEMMIECMERMLASAYRLSPLLSGARLWITQYYSVMLDGEVCVPWNWDREDE